MAFLSHSSPLTLGDIAKQSEAKQNDSEIDLAILVIFPLCVLRILKDPMAARFCLHRDHVLRAQSGRLTPWHRTNVAKTSGLIVGPLFRSFGDIRAMPWREPA